jgi:hypothetical protein
MKWRITVRSDQIELRGYIEGEQPDLVALADAFKPLNALVMASPADDDYYPWERG